MPSGCSDAIQYLQFCSVLFSSVLFCSIQFCSVLLYSVLFCSALFSSVLFCSVLGCVRPQWEVALCQSPPTFCVFCGPFICHSLLPHDVISNVVIWSWDLRLPFCALTVPHRGGSFCTFFTILAHQILTLDSSQHWDVFSGWFPIGLDFCCGFCVFDFYARVVLFKLDSILYWVCCVFWGFQLVRKKFSGLGIYLAPLYLRRIQVSSPLPSLPLHIIQLIVGRQCLKGTFFFMSPFICVAISITCWTFLKTLSSFMQMVH